MIRKSLTHLGLCLALALLCCALFGISAMAEDIGFNVTCPDLVVPAGENAIIGYYIDPSTLPEGVNEEDLTIACVVKDVSADDAVVYDEDVPDDLGEEGRGFEIPARRLKDGHAYRVDVTVTPEEGEALASGGGWFSYGNSETEETEVALWLNDGDLGATVRVHEDVMVNIYAPDATAIELFNGYEYEDLRDSQEWEGWFWDSWDRELTVPLAWSEPGTHPVYARVRTGDPDDPKGRWYITQVARVNVTASGEFGAPNVTFSGEYGDQVRRGEKLTYEVADKPDGAERLIVMAWDPDTGRDYYHDEVYANGTYTIPTADMAPGNYKLHVWWYAVDRQPTKVDLPFTVTEQPVNHAVFGVDRNTVTTHQGYALYGYVQGASGLCVFEGSDNRATFEGQDSFLWYDGAGEAGERTYTLGQWDDQARKWVKLDKDVTVTVTAEGDMPQIEIEPEKPAFSYLQEESFTATVAPTGEDTLPEGTWYHYELHREDNWDRVLEGDIGTEDEITFECYDLEENICYKLQVWANRWDYNSSYDEILFVVVPSEPDESRVSLNFYPFEGCKINDTVEIWISTPEEAHVELFWEGHWERLSSMGDTMNYHVTMRPGDDNDHLLVARACFDEIDDWQWEDAENDDFDWTYGKAKLLKVTGQDDVKLPAIALDKNMYGRGETVNVTLSELSENAQEYHVRIIARNERGDFEDEAFFAAVRDIGREGSIEVKLPTARLIEGDYMVSVAAIGKPGWRNADTDRNDQSLIFHVSEPAAGSIMFKGNSPVWTHDTIAVSAYVPGAERLCVFENGEIRSEFDGDSFVFFDGDGNPGIREYRLGIWDDANDAWDQPNDVDPVRVIIMAKEDSKLGDPQIDPPIQTAYGGYLRFKFEPVEGAEWYYVSVRDESDDWRTVFELDCNHQNDDEAVYEFTVPSSRIQEGHSYVISVDANARGCASGHSEARAVAVSSDVGPSIALTAYAITGDDDDNESNDTLDLDANTRFGLHVTVNADGVEIDSDSYQLFYDDEWHELDPYDDMDIDDSEDVQDGDFRFRWGSGNSGIKMALIRAQYHDDEADEWRWAYSNSVQMNITSDGPATLPQLNLVNGQVMRGDLLLVNIDTDAANDETTECYHMRIYPCQGDRWEEKVFREAGLDEAVVGLPTGELAPGQYRVQTIAIGRPGYDNAWVDEEEDLYFTVTERTGDPRVWATTLVDGEVVESEPKEDDPNVEELTVITGQRFSVNAWAPGLADGNELEIYCRRLDDGSITGDNFAAGEWAPDWIGDFVFKLYSIDEEADERTELPQSLVVHVTGEELAAPVIEHTPVLVLSGGEDETAELKFRFYAVENAERYYVEIFPDVGSDYEEFELSDDELSEDEDGARYFEYVFPGELRANTVYTFRVTAYSYGYAPGEAFAKTVVRNGAEVEIGLTLQPLENHEPSGEATVEPLNVRMSQEVEAAIRVPLPEVDEPEDGDVARPTRPTKVQVLWRNGWETRWEDLDPEDCNDEGEGFVVYTARNHASDDTADVVARVTFDESETAYDWEGNPYESFDNAEWLYSNAVRLTTEAGYGQVAVPDVALAYDGDTYTVSLQLENLPEADTYTAFWVRVVREDEDGNEETIETFCEGCEGCGELEDDEFGETDHRIEPETTSIELTLPDYALPGEYFVTLDVEPAVGYTWNSVGGIGNEDGLSFTVPVQFGLVVKDEGSDEEHLVKELTVAPYSNVTLWAVVGEDTSYNVFRDWEEHVDWYIEPGQNRREEISIGGKGEHTFYLVKEANNGPTVIDTVTVYAEGEEPKQLEKPVIEAEPVFDLTDADFLTDGYPITVYYDEPAGKRFNIEVFDEDATNEAIENGEDWPEPIFYAEMEGSDFVNGAYDCAIPANDENDEPRFKANGRYILFVNVEAEGMLGNHGALNFVESHSAAEQLVLTIAGQTGGTVETQASKDLSISIDVNGVSEEELEPGKVELFWNNEWHSMENEEVTWNDDGCRFEFRWSTQGHSVAVARILDGNDGNDEPVYIYSNPVAVNAAIKGSVKPVAVTLDKRRVRRGQLLKVNIVAAEDDWAKEYHVRIYGYGYGEDGYDGDEEVEYYRGVYAPGTQTIELPTSQLPVGEENNYRVDVYVRPVEGATDWSTSGENPDLRFTVLEGRQIAFDIDRATVPTQTDAFISAFVPGAEEIQILVDGEVMYDGEEEWGHAWGEGCEAHYGSDHEGDHTFTLRYRIEGEDEFRTYGTELALRVNAEGGDLDEPGIGIGTVVDPTGEVGFTVTMKGGPASRYVDIEVRDTAMDERVWHFGNEVEGSEASFAIEPGELQDGHSYALCVYNAATDYNYAYAEKRFLAMKAPEDEEAPHYVVRVNGSTDPVTVQANEPFLISYELKGGADISFSGIELLWYGEWTNDFNWQDFRQGIFTMSADEDQIIAIRAEYYDYENSDNYYLFSNVVQVNVDCSGGRVDEPKPVLSVNELARGEELNVTFAGDTARAEGYTLDVERLGYHVEDEGWRDDWQCQVSLYAPSAEQVTFTVPTAALWPDFDHRVVVHAHGKQGYAGNESDRDVEGCYFRVSDAEIGEPLFTIDKTSVDTQERFTITAAHPDPDARLCLFRGNNKEGMDEEWRGSFNTTWQEGEPGDYAFCLGVFDERVRGYRRLNETEVTVTVRDADPLGDAVIDVPAAINVGEDLSFSFKAVPRAQWYDVEVIGIGEDEDWVTARWNFEDVGDDDFAYSFSISEDQFYSDTMYEVRVHAHAGGYADSHASKRFTVLPVPDEADERSIAVSVEPAPAPGESLPVHTQLEFTAVSTGFEPDALQIFWDDEWQDIERRDITGDLQNATVVKDMYRSGSIAVLFRAGENDDEGEPTTWVYSDPVTLEIAKGEPITGFDAQLKAQTAAQGDVIDLTLRADEEIRAAIDHFDVQVHAMNEWGDYYEHRYSLYVPGLTDEAGVTVGLPTLELEPGATYRVQVNACGKLGYEDSTLPYDQEDLYFEVTEQPEAEPMFTVSKTELTAGENYTLSARAPGAWKLVFYRDGEEWFNWGDGPDENPEQMTSCEGFDQAGTYTLELIALNKRGDEMDYAFDPIEITVNSKGALAEVDASDWPLTLTVGDDDGYTFTVKPVAGATRYDIHVIDEDSNFDPQDDLLHWNGAITDPNGKTFTVDASKFADYEAGRLFRVGVYAGADGYDASWVESRFALVDPEALKLNLSLKVRDGDAVIPGDDGSYSLWTNKWYTVCAAPGEGLEGIKAVQIDWHGEWEPLFKDGTDTWSTDVNSAPGNCVMLARYTSAETIDENTEWTLAGDSLQLRFKSMGQVAPVEYTLNTRDGKLLSTQDLEVSFEYSGTNVDHFEVFVRLDDDTNDDISWQVPREPSDPNDVDVWPWIVEKNDSGVYSWTIPASDIMEALPDAREPFETELRVSVDAIAEECYEDNYSDYRKEPRFTIMESYGTVDFMLFGHNAWIAGKPLKLDLPEAEGLESYTVEISQSGHTVVKDENVAPGEYTASAALTDTGYYTCTVTAVPEWGYDVIEPQSFDMKVISAEDANGKKLVLPAMLTGIDDEAFMNNDALIVVVLPQGIQSIGSNAFANCDKLAFVILPDNANMDTLFAVGIPNVFEGSDGVSLITRAEAAELGITLN